MASINPLTKLRMNTFSHHVADFLFCLVGSSYAACNMPVSKKSNLIFIEIRFDIGKSAAENERPKSQLSIAVFFVVAVVELGASVASYAFIGWLDMLCENSKRTSLLHTDADVALNFNSNNRSVHRAANEISV